MSQNSEVIHVRVPVADYKRLAKISKEDRRSLNFLVNEAIQQFLFNWRKTEKRNA